MLFFLPFRLPLGVNGPDETTGAASVRVGQQPVLSPSSPPAQPQASRYSIAGCVSRIRLALHNLRVGRPAFGLFCRSAGDGKTPDSKPAACPESSWPVLERLRTSGLTAGHSCPVPLHRPADPRSAPRHETADTPRLTLPPDARRPRLTGACPAAQCARSPASAGARSLKHAAPKRSEARRASARRRRGPDPPATLWARWHQR